MPNTVTYGFFCFLVFTFVIIANSTAASTTTEYAQTAYINGLARTIEFRWSIGSSANYGVSGSAENDVLVAQLSVPTRGYIAWGLSPDGGMPNSNMLVMWVDDDDGRVHVQDRYTSADHVEPSIIADEKSSVVHYSGSQNATHTVVQFVRWIDVGCRNNNKHSVSITHDSTRVIYAFGDADPNSSGHIKYHGPLSRGNQTLYLLDDPHGEFERNRAATLRDGVLYEYTSKNFRVPAKDTTYQCTFYQLPEITTEVQAIGFEPIIDPNSRDMIHHMAVHVCDYGAFSSSSPPKVPSFTCFDTPKWQFDANTFQCTKTIFWGWGLGGYGIFLPQDIGFPLTPLHSRRYFLLEIHYDNPSLRADRLDNTGFRFWLSDKLRRREASRFSLFANHDDTLIVPGNTPTFTIPVACHPACTQNNIPREGTRIFSLGFHTHRLGVSTALRHFRNGVELPPILGDKSYDFNYQQYRPVNATLLPGDSIVLECNYSSAGRRSQATLGGPSTSQEMCNAHLYVTPPVLLTSCILSVDPIPLKNLLETADPRVLKTIEWNALQLPLVNKLQDFYLNSKQFYICSTNEHDAVYSGYPQLTGPWLPYTPAPSSSQCASAHTKGVVASFDGLSSSNEKRQTRENSIVSAQKKNKQKHRKSKHTKKGHFKNTMDLYKGFISQEPTFSADGIFSDVFLTPSM